MAIRSRMSRGHSRRLFAKGASRTHWKNLGGPSMRGGIAL